MYGVNAELFDTADEMFGAQLNCSRWLRVAQHSNTSKGHRTTEKPNLLTAVAGSFVGHILDRILEPSCFAVDSSA